MADAAEALVSVSVQTLPAVAEENEEEEEVEVDELDTSLSLDPATIRLAPTIELSSDEEDVQVIPPSTGAISKTTKISMVSSRAILKRKNVSWAGITDVYCARMHKKNSKSKLNLRMSRVNALYQQFMVERGLHITAREALVGNITEGQMANMAMSKRCLELMKIDWERKAEGIIRRLESVVILPNAGLLDGAAVRRIAGEEIAVENWSFLVMTRSACMQAEAVAVDARMQVLADLGAMDSALDFICGISIEWEKVHGRDW
jgi:hypothetical protein